MQVFCVFIESNRKLVLNFPAHKSLRNMGAHQGWTSQIEIDPKHRETTSFNILFIKYIYIFLFEFPCGAAR